MREGDEHLLSLAESLVGQHAASVVKPGTHPLPAEVQPQAVMKAAAQAATNALISSRSERNPMLVKLCLAYDREADIEVRLNYYYRNSYTHDSWHNHRWSFWSRILRGSAVHRVASSREPDAESCALFRHGAGDSYYVGPDLYHSFVPVPGTITLLFRGRVTGSSWSRSEVVKDGHTLRATNELIAEQEVLSTEQYLVWLRQVEQRLADET